MPVAVTASMCAPLLAIPVLPLLLLVTAATSIPSAASSVPPQDCEENSMAAFQAADVRADGYLDQGEFATILKTVGLQWEGSQVEALFVRLDVNPTDGKIEEAEWVALACGTVAPISTTPAPDPCAPTTAAPATNTTTSSLVIDLEGPLKRLIATAIEVWAQAHLTTTTHRTTTPKLLTTAQAAQVTTVTTTEASSSSSLWWLWVLIALLACCFCLVACAAAAAMLFKGKKKKKTKRSTSFDDDGYYDDRYYGERERMMPEGQALMQGRQTMMPMPGQVATTNLPRVMSEPMPSLAPITLPPIVAPMVPVTTLAPMTTTAAVPVQTTSFNTYG